MKTDPTVPRRRRRRPPLSAVLLGVLAVFVAAEACARLIIGLTSLAPDPRARADAYHGADWTPGYFRALRKADLAWSPYVAWAHRPFVGGGITIDPDGRRSWSDPAGAADGSVAIYGGSTVWGVGARDDHTLPSAVGQVLAASGIHVAIQNRGQTGYVTGQDVVHAWLRLREGETPAVAVFYGGASDAFAAWQSGRAGIPQNDANRAAEFNATQPTSVAAAWRVLTAGARRLFSGLGDAPAAVPHEADAALVADVASRYAHDIKAACAMVAAAHGRCLFVWQPMVIDKPLQTPYEMAQASRYGSFWPFYRAVQTAVRRDAAPSADWIDASATFAAMAAPMYIDAFHLSEEGYRAIAEAIASAVAARLAARP
jgi:lysophospholipase L1-like esterase